MAIATQSTDCCSSRVAWSSCAGAFDLSLVNLELTAVDKRNNGESASTAGEIGLRDGEELNNLPMGWVVPALSMSSVEVRRLESKAQLLQDRTGAVRPNECSTR